MVETFYAKKIKISEDDDIKTLKIKANKYFPKWFMIH